MTNYCHPNAYGAEGVDHINISVRSQTRLGLLLDPSYYKIVDYPHIGKFSSVLNLWYWLKTSPLDDSVRRLTGFKLRNRIAGMVQQKHVHNFRAIIALATYRKLLQYPHILDDLRNLPADVDFISYYTPKGSAIRICSNYAATVVEIVQLIKRAVDKGQTPDYTPLLTRHSAQEFYFLEPFLMENFGPDSLASFNNSSVVD